MEFHTGCLNNYFIENDLTAAIKFHHKGLSHKKEFGVLTG